MCFPASLVWVAGGDGAGVFDFSGESGEERGAPFLSDFSPFSPVRAFVRAFVFQVICEVREMIGVAGGWGDEEGGRLEF